MTRSSDTPSGDENFHYKIEEETERLIRLHQAETGMNLTRDLTTEAGQLLFRKGETLTSGMIEKLKQFQVCRLHVKDTRTRWVNETVYQAVRDRATLIEKKTVPPSDGNSTDEETETGDGTFQELFALIGNLQTPNQLRDLLDNLDESVSRDRLENNLPENHFERTVEQNEKHREQFSNVLQQLDDLNDPNDRASLLQYLFKEREGEDLDILDEVPEDLWDSVTRVLEHQKKTKAGLQGMLHNSSTLNEQMEQDHLRSFNEDVNSNDNDWTELDPSPGDQIEEGELINQLYQMLSSNKKHKAEYRDLLEMIEAIDFASSKQKSTDSREYDPKFDALKSDHLKFVREALSGRRNQSSNAGLESFKNALKQFQNENWHDGIDQFHKSLQEKPSINAHTIENLMEESRTNKDRQTQLERRLERELDGDASEMIDRLLDAPRAEVLKELHDREVAESLIDDILKFHENTKSLVVSSFEELSAHLPDFLDGVEADLSQKIVDRFQDLANRLKDNWLDNSGQWDLYQRNVSEHGTVEKRNEKLQDALDRGDIGDLKRYTRLPGEVIDQYRERYRRPTQINKWQKKLIDSTEQLLEQFVLTMRVPDDQLNRHLKQMSDVLTNQSKPYSLLCQPPDPQHYHLVHAYNTCLISVIIGRDQNLPTEAIRKLVPAALLADIGLTIIPPSLYLKNKDLSRRADNEISKHPTYSRKIVSPIYGSEHTVTKVVAEHHEHPDGEGYPRGLNEDQLHPLSSLLTVADVYTARLEERVYRSGQMPDQILREMRNEPKRFNKGAVDSIVRRMGVYPNGSVVKLSNNQIAYVRSQNPEDPLNPVVILLTDVNRNKLDDPVKQSLAKFADLDVKLVVKSNSGI